MGESTVGGNEQDRETLLTAGRNGAVARFPQETNIEDIGPQWLTLNGSELDTEYKQVSVASGRLDYVNGVDRSERPESVTQAGGGIGGPFGGQFGAVYL